MKRKEAASMIDITMVQNNHSVREVEALVETARKYGCAAVFVMPCYTGIVRRGLEGSGVLTGGLAGFPGGANTTDVKCMEAEDSIRNGAEELDMVINLGWMKSGMYEQVREEVKRIKEIAGERTLKCILEVNDLTEDEIKRASLLVVEGGADYVKTSTGWKGATKLEHIKLIRSVIGNSAKIKAAGGIRTADTIRAFYEAGASRFGIGAASAVSILDSLPE